MAPQPKIGSQALLRIVEFVPNNQQARQYGRNGEAHAQAVGEWQNLDRTESRSLPTSSHEFRTPVTLIFGQIEKMLSRTDDEESKCDLQLMQRHAQDLLQLIEKNGDAACNTLEKALQPSAISVPSVDEAFLKKAVAVVEKHIDDEFFSVEDLAREMGLCRVQFHRKIRALTNHSTSHFIRAIRLQRAASLLKQNAGSVTEIAYQVGFGSHPYFTKCFQEYFGMSPKEYKMQQ